MNLNSLDMNLLPVLNALLEERHVTRAGKRVGLSQPATSSALERLRAIFRDPLLVRNGNALRLTERAVELRLQLAPILEALSAALDPAADFNLATARGTLRIATTNHVALLLFPQLQSALGREAPGVKLEVHELAELDGPASLREDRLDLLIGTYRRTSPQLRKSKLFDEELTCVVRKDHPALYGTNPGEPMPLHAFLDYQHLRIAVVRADPGAVAVALAAMKLERRVACEVPDYLAAPFIIAETDLICVVGVRVASRFKEMLGLELRPLPLAIPPAPFHMVWHPRLDGSPLHVWSRGVLQSIAEKL